MRRRVATGFAGAAAVITLLGACATGDGDPGATTSVAPERSRSGPTAGDQPTGGDEPEPVHEGAPRTAEPSGEWDLVLVDVRVAEHERFDRIVLEFAGTGSPGWSVDHVDEAVLDGSGTTFALRGDTVLDIYAAGTTWPTPGYYAGPRRFEPSSGGDIREVLVGGTFEGHTQVLAGIEGAPGPVRVFALPRPPRLVVDVLDSAGRRD